jgi:acetate kinase
MRDIENAIEKGNERAKIALEVYTYRLKKYIGSYIAVLGGLDVLVFTGGVGENADTIRTDICDGLSCFGIDIDEQRNKGLRGRELLISKQDAKVKIIVVPTDEEFMIASDTQEIVNS